MGHLILCSPIRYYLIQQTPSVFLHLAYVYTNKLSKGIFECYSENRLKQFLRAYITEIHIRLRLSFPLMSGNSEFRRANHKLVPEIRNVGQLIPRVGGNVLCTLKQKKKCFLHRKERFYCNCMFVSEDFYLFVHSTNTY